jgi:hypothetical protein
MASMKQERVILSFIMVMIGLLVAGVAFYIYQGTKTINATKTTVLVSSPSPTPIANSVYLNVTNPTDESVTDNKTVTVSGQTTPDATIVILTNSDQDVIQPSKQGDFSTTVIIANGENLIRITAFGADGQSTSIQKTITYSTDDF